VNRPLLNTLHPDEVDVMIQRVEEAEVDEMWSYVGKKREPRWLWHAIDHRSGHVLAYVLGRRKEICRSYYDSRKSLYLVAACGNHECIGFVKARTVVSMSARRSFRR
jgi:IS1 transposase